MSAPQVNPEVIRQVAEEYGTPCFLFDVERFRANVQRFQRVFHECAQRADVYYSVKTNYLPHLLRLLPGLGLGADVVSGFELQAALDAGVMPQQIVFNGPLKTRDELETAVQRGLRVNIDGIPELGRLDELARQVGKTVRIGLRVNPGRNPYLSRDPSFNTVATTKSRHSKFGWLLGTESLEEMLCAIERSPNLRLDGIHCHLGSQITDTNGHLAAIEDVLRFIKSQAGRFEITNLNVGGGFGVRGIRRDRSGPLKNYLHASGIQTLETEDSFFDLDTFGASLKAVLQQEGLKHLTLGAEPGRFLVSDAFCLVTRVANVKPPMDGKRWVVIDGGLNLLPTAGPTETHRIQVMGKENVQESEFMLGGPLCYDADVWSYAARLPINVAEGDIVIIHDAGAYSISRSTNFIRPRAPVVALDGEKLGLCWRREDYKDIFAFDEHLA